MFGKHGLRTAHEAVEPCGRRYGQCVAEKLRDRVTPDGSILLASCEMIRPQNDNFIPLLIVTIKNEQQAIVASLDKATKMSSDAANS